MGSSSSSGGGGAATTTSRSFPAGLQISSKPLPGADNSSAQATKPSLERQGSDGEFKKTTIVYTAVHWVLRQAPVTEQGFFWAF